MKAHYRLLKNLGKLSHVLASALMIASLLINAIPSGNAYAASGSIWTTRETCDAPNPVNENQYAVGETVHIRGENFDAETTVYWEIFKPGNNSDVLIDSGEGETDVNGYFCVTAHTILLGEDGVYKYKVTVGNSKKSDNYSVVGIITAPGLSIDKNAAPLTYTTIGQSIIYTYLVTNTGNVELTNINVVDDKVSVTCPETTLAAGARMTCTATYAITLDDLDAGSLTNVAYAEGNYVDTPVTSDPDSVTITAIPNPLLTINKNATPGTYDAVSQTISYSYLVTNAGNITLTGITVSDNKAAVNCPGNTLTPTESMTCTATYSISQADLDSGYVTNIATADSNQTGQVQDSETVNALITPGISIDKTAFPETYAAVGDVINYGYEITNTGNVTLTNIVVDDDLLGLICTVASLAPQASTTCTASHAITQADLDAGSITNVGSADSDQTGEVTDTETVTTVQDENISLDKIADPVTYDEVGDVISYEYVVTNTGNITLSNIVVVDDKASVSCPGDTLLPGESMTCTASYNILQADLNSGSVTNIATVTSDQTDPVQDSETVNAINRPAMTLAKSADPLIYNQENQVINYSYLVTNTGNITLTGITVTDDKASVDCLGIDSLQPGDSMTCLATYTITQDDLDNGSVTNLATAVSDQTQPVHDSETINANSNPSMNLIKTAFPTTYDEVGDVITYHYLVINNGNITLTDIQVTDDKASVTCPFTNLAPTTDMTCSASYIITQADLDGGSVTNHAEATSNETDPVQDEETVYATQQPSMTLAKDASVATYDAVGESIIYSYLVTNTGNVTLNGITVTDDKVAVVDCPGTTLVPGDFMVCASTYLIIQADLDNGLVTNHATADSNETEPVYDEVTITADQNPAISLEKSANPLGYNEVGDIINYEYLVTNEGNITLTGITVTDDKASVTCPSASLAPGASMVCNASYTIGQGDLDLGYVTNIAQADSNQTGPYTDTATVNADVDAILSLVKSASPANYDEVGDVISYEYLVTNEGNITLHGITVTDDKAAVNCPVSTLAPGAAMTCTASYSILQANLDSGSVTNIATADSTESNPVQDTETVDALPAPGINIDKTASPETYGAIGDIIDYSYEITNTGNITLTNIVVEDDLLGSICTVASLAPQASTTCTASHTVTLADLNAGSITNVGSADSDQTGEVTDTETVTAEQDENISLDKIADPATYDEVGDVISYDYVVTNTSNITLTNIVINDDRLGLICTIASLMPQASTTCTATYVITQDDLDGGSITNVAIATSNQTDPVQDSETVNALDRPAMTLEKSADPVTYNQENQVISYSYLVTNIGNITLTGIAVTDDKITTVDCPATTLAPAAFVTCTGSYTITQDDLDNGSVTNYATADSEQTEPVEDDETVEAVQLPEATMEKTADPETYAAVGDIISYEYLVHNSGNITLTGVYVLDDKATVTCPSDTLAPLASMTCTAEYTITQADLDEGYVINTAQVFSEETDPYTDTATVNALIEAMLTITKTASESSYYATGDTIEYTYVVTNGGNVTLSALSVFDDKTSVTCPKDTLMPGESMICTALYIVTDADMAAWSVTNVAYAEGIIGSVEVEEQGETIRSNEVSLQVPRFVVLSLTSFCTADPLNYDGWRVVNNNPYPVSFEYIIADSNVAGVGQVPANGVAEIYTPHGAGSGQLRLYSAGVLLATAKAATNCVVNENVPPEVPVIPTPFVVIPPTGSVLIPVTGAANPLHIPVQRLLFSLSIGFAGVGFLLQGFSRRRKEI